MQLHNCKGHHLHYSLRAALWGTAVPQSPQCSGLLPLSRIPSRHDSLGTMSILSLYLSIPWGLNTPCSTHRKPWEGSAPASRCYHSPGSGPWTVCTNLAEFERAAPGSHFLPWRGGESSAQCGPSYKGTEQNWQGSVARRCQCSITTESCIGATHPSLGSQHSQQPCNNEDWLSNQQHETYFEDKN